MGEGQACAALKKVTILTAKMTASLFGQGRIPDKACSNSSIFARPRDGHVV